MGILRSQRGFVLLAVAVLIGFLASTNTLPAADQCSHVEGKVQDQVILCPGGATGLCTLGRVIGVLSGTYDFALTSLLTLSGQPSPFPPTALKCFFTAESTIHTKHGDLFLKEAGSVSFDSGNLVDIWTINGGTGKWVGASGEVFAVGAFNFAAGSGEVLYRGDICTPK